jgi:carboxypeptidase family protein
MRNLLRVVLFSCAIALPLFAQIETGRIDGTVQDQSGAIVPNARAVATNVKTERTAQATSDQQGNFVLTPLQPGLYRLTVEAAGFRKFVINALEVNVDTRLSQIVKLEVGQTTETVMVEANTVSVQTTESQVGEVINIRDIDTLPQLGRTPIGLAVFATPGVQVFQQGSNAGADTSFSHINGTRGGSNNSTLDGIDVNDAVAPRLGLSLTANNTDSVAEFRVVTEGGKAEYGRNAGGQVELISRSGTNEYHGNLYDYLRNTVLNSTDFFSNSAGVTKPVFIQNIFGGSLGGPIKHNKLFIFGNYQGRRTHQQISRTRTVPTDSARQGIFKWKTGATINSYDILANDPRKKGIDPFMATMLKIYPEPNTTSVGDGLNSSGFRFNNPNGSLEDQFTIKADYNVNDKHHIFFRQSWQRNSSIDSLNSADAQFPGLAQGSQGGKRWGYVSGMGLDDYRNHSEPVPLRPSERHYGFCPARTHRWTDD